MRRLVHGAFNVVLLLSASSCGDGSSGVPTPNVTQVNSHETGIQSGAKVAMLAGGDVVIAWNSFDQDGDGFGVFAHLYSSSLQPRGEEFQVNVETTGSQLLTAVAPLANGGFVVAWSLASTHGPFRAFGRRYDPDGAADGEPFEVESGLGDAFAIDGEGRFVVAERDTCQTYDYGQREFTCITGRRTQADGALAGYNFFSGPAHSDFYGYLIDQAVPAVAASTDGQFVVVWNEKDSYFGHHGNYEYVIYGAAFNARASLQGEQGIVGSPGLQRSQPQASMNEIGSFVVAWDFCDPQYDPSGYPERYCYYAGIEGMRQTSDGGRSWFDVSTNNAYGEGQYDDRVTAASINARDEFVVVWERSERDADDGHVMAARFDHQTHPIGTPFVVVEERAELFCCAQAAMQSDGSVIVVWSGSDSSDSGVFARHVPALEE